MGMFDYYEPVPILKCPECLISLREWQGKEGENALFVWRQGERAPIFQRAGDWNISDENRAKFRLPSKFVIYSHDCPNHVVVAACVTENETWRTTKIVDVQQQGT